MVTTRYPNGVTNAEEGSALGDFGAPDPSRFHLFFDDFDQYVATAWTVTEDNATSAATEGIADADGGVLVLTPAAVDNDFVFLQTKEIFTFEAGKKLWFKARWKLSEATDSDAVMGLQVTDITPLAVSDGVYFNKADDATTLNLVVVKTAGSTTTTAVTTIAANTYVETAFVYNGDDAIDIYLNDVRVARSVITNLPTTELAISFGCQNGSTGAKTMSVDYIFCAKQRHAEVA